MENVGQPVFRERILCQLAIVRIIVCEYVL